MKSTVRIDGEGPYIYKRKDTSPLGRRHAEAQRTFSTLRALGTRFGRLKATIFGRDCHVDEAFRPWDRNADLTLAS